MSDYRDKRFTTVDEFDIETVLADDIEFTGELSFTDSLYIKGQFIGDINAEGSLYIGEHAVIKGDIRASFVSLKGRVEGDIYASGRIELLSKSYVEGDIVCPDIKKDSGSIFNGRCIMKKPEEIKEMRNEKK
ncbi:MAG: polymer-forming cytoskeletal protein [Spirochaetales bacterium]|nr:polymer-forming cytoskeletal protein [Spirochaetales bacterium]